MAHATCITICLCNLLTSVECILPEDDGIKVALIANSCLPVNSTEMTATKCAMISVAMRIVMICERSSLRNY